MSILDQDLMQSMLQAADKDNKYGLSQNAPESLNLLIKVIQLEQFSEKDINAYLTKICNNQMTIPVLEVILSIIRLYSFKRIQGFAHINNPQAFAVIKDLEDFLLQEITCILQNNKENIVINYSKIDLIMNYIKKKYGKIYFNIWITLKKIINK